MIESPSEVRGSCRANAVEANADLQKWTVARKKKQLGRSLALPNHVHPEVRSTRVWSNFILARPAMARYKRGPENTELAPMRMNLQMAKKKAAGGSSARLSEVLEAHEGLLRLAPTWVPRSFLMPGRRIKLAPQDLYALGAHRGGIDERWFSSTTVAANEGAPPDEGLSYVVVEGKRAFTLRDAVAAEGARLVGPGIW